MPKTAIIIPAKNEASNIGRVLEDVHIFLPEADIIVVDDNSEDGTRSIVRGFGGAILLASPVTLGIGGTVQLGVAYCWGRDYDLFIRMDGDGQHPAEALPELVKAQKPGSLVQGSRSSAGFTSSSSLLRKLGSLYFRMLFKLLTGKSIPDPTSGFVCFGRDIAERFKYFFPSDFPEIESGVLLLRAGFDIIPVHVEMKTRQGGESSINFFHSIVYMYSVSIAFLVSFIRANPYGSMKGGGM